MHEPTQYYLILDRCEPGNPRWVVAKACTSHPAAVPADLDRDDGLAAGTRWLGEFHAHHFSWLEFLFGRQTSLRMTRPGEECFATRISHGGTHLPDHTAVYHAGSLSEHVTA